MGDNASDGAATKRGLCAHHCTWRPGRLAATKRVLCAGPCRTRVRAAVLARAHAGVRACPRMGAYICTCVLFRAGMYALMRKTVRTPLVVTAKHVHECRDDIFV